MGRFGSGRDPPAGICSDTWLSHESWPDEVFPPQAALFRHPTPQDGPRLGRSYSSLLRSQHPHHRKGGSVTELEKGEHCLTMRTRSLAMGMDHGGGFSTCSPSYSPVHVQLCRRPALQDTHHSPASKANAPLDTQPLQKAINLPRDFSLMFLPLTLVVFSDKS